MWTAFEAHLEDVPDAEIIAYADDKSAILITTNRDCALLAQKMTLARVVWLNVNEVDALDGMKRAAEWMDGHHLPNGRVLRVSKNRDPLVLNPRRR